MDVRMPDGTTIKNVPDGITQEELLSRYSASQQPVPAQPQQQQGWFPGYSYVNPPSQETVQQTTGALRGALADFGFGPAQMVAGLADIANTGAKQLNWPGANDTRMSQAVSSARNIVGGRPGTGAGPMTGLVQGLATAPMGGGFTRSLMQGAGLGAGLATSEESVMEEGGKGAAVAGGMSMLGKLLGRAPKKSSAEERLVNIAKREGVPMRYGTISNTPQLKEMEARAERNMFLGFGRGNIAFREREAADNAMAKAVWRKIGIEADEFTPTNFKTAASTIGNKLQEPFKNGDIPFKGSILQMSVDNAIRVTDDMSRPEFVVSAANLVDKKMLTGKMSPSELNVMMDDLRSLADKAYDDKNKVAGDAISKLLKAVKTHVIAQIPDQSKKEAYKEALTQWANLKVVEDVFVKSPESARGNIDYSKLKAAIERAMPSGYVYSRASLSDLAELGLAMKGKQALPEGLKATLTDPAAYLGFNNPMSAWLRDRSINAPVLQAGFKAAGVQAGTE